MNPITWGYEPSPDLATPTGHTRNPGYIHGNLPQHRWTRGVLPQMAGENGFGLPMVSTMREPGMAKGTAQLADGTVVVDLNA